MNPKWTFRMFSLARPFVGVSIEDTFAALERFLGRRMPTLEFFRVGDKRATKLESWEELNSLSWRDKLTISGIDRAVEVSAYLYKFKPKGQAYTASAANYQCHEVVVDFDIEGVANKEVSAVAEQLTVASILFRSELSILCPLEQNSLRQLYRERGLLEGLPGIFEIMVMGSTFSSAMDVESIRSRLTHPVVAFSREGYLAVVADVQKLHPMETSQRAELKSLLGDSLFAGPREISKELSGVYSVFELFRSLRKARKADLEALSRSSHTTFNFDWSGVFD